MHFKLPSRGSVGLRKTAGFTAIEILMTLSILGILAGIGIVKLQPQSDRVFANDLQLLIQQSRFEAVKRNTPVAIVWNKTEQQFESKYTTGSLTISDVCTNGHIKSTRSLSEYPQLTISGDLDDGIVWLPNGSARKCDGTLPAASFSVAKTNSTSAYTLTVEQSGHIRIVRN